MWVTTLNSLVALRRAVRRPESLYLTGHLRGSQRSLTLATLMEEVDQVFVCGVGDWAGQVWREANRIKVAPAQQGRPRQSNSRRQR